MTDNTLKLQSFKLKGRLYTLTVLSLLNASPDEFESQLADIISKAPRMFKNAPIVIDCSGIDGSDLDLQTICKLARKEGLVPVAIQGGSPVLDMLAQHQGLAVLNASSSHDKPLLSEDKQAKKTSKERIIKSKTLVSPVRSGQQVVSEGDLVIASTVSNGAELLADGHIHVYGSLRGRALAGISGDKNARIFCQSLDAELVSIAGFYRLSDAIEPIRGACQIYLQDDQIQIAPI